MNLSFLFGKAQTAERLTPDEIQFAEGLVASADVNHAVMANGILFISGNDKQGAAACDRLRQICEDASLYERGAAVATLLLILEYFPKRAFEATPCFAKLAYGGAKHSFLGARVNAMRVLRQLASIRDQKAIELLQESLHDPNEFVSTTARISLELAGVDGTRAN